MHKGKTQYVIAFNAEFNTYISAWWCESAYLYFMQSSDRVDEKTMSYGPVNVDPMYGNDLSVVIRECWEGYDILEYNQNYTG